MAVSHEGRADPGRVNPLSPRQAGLPQPSSWLKRPSPAPALSPPSSRPAFAELHAISNFSFLRGASHPGELVRQAQALGYSAIAITDECSVAGAVRAHVAARACQREHAERGGEPGGAVKLIVGSEFRLVEDVHLVLLAPSRLAYGRLSALITRARRRGRKGEYVLRLDDLHQGAGECLALWIPGREPIAELIARGQRLKTLLPRLWIAFEAHLDPTDAERCANALALSMRLDLPVVASNDVHMHAPHRGPLLDLLAAIRRKTTVAGLGAAAQSNRERHLRPLSRLAALYPGEMLAESAAIAERCRFSLDELRYEYPEELVPPGFSPGAYLRKVTWEGARERWPEGVPGEVAALLEKELALIESLSYEFYFLTVYDVVRYARSRGILCQGRGSAANSAVCYCLHVTEVDPSRMHLLFERFVSRERNEPPDIDVDFEHERREEVIQYIYARYGRDRAALAASLITYRPRSAIRDVGKALGLDPALIDSLARSMAWWDERGDLGARLRAAGVAPESALARHFLHLVDEIQGFPRHLSQHTGGFVISKGPLAQLVPIENAAMADRTVIQWDKDDLESLGLLKVDVLGLGMLTAIRKTLALVNGYRGGDLRMEGIPREDPETYAMLQRGDSVGVFQVESRAQMAMLPRLRPRSYYDLVIEVAIVRPGPIQGDMVHPYLRRRDGLEPVTATSEEVHQVLKRTLGVPIFQEQVIELAMVAAGFTAGEADQLRRAMAAWRRRGGIERFEEKLIRGMLERGHDRGFAERVFRQIKGFGEYGFPESHAASFALLVYVSAWLKRHEPAAFYCGLLNSLPMGFYSPSQLVQDALAHHVVVREVDVQASGWDHRLEPGEPGTRAVPGKAGASGASGASEKSGSPGAFDEPGAPGESGRGPGGVSGRRGAPPPEPAIRLGMRRVKGLARESAERIAAAQPFRDVGDLGRRAALGRRDLLFLARAGALRSLSGHRHQAHWDAAGVEPPGGMWRAAGASCRTKVRLHGPTPGEDLIADYRYLGLTLGPHPMALLRKDGAFRGCRRTADLRACGQDRFVRVAGIVTGRQRPGTASGIVFLTLEDETGNGNVIVRSAVLRRYRSALLQGRLLAIDGVVERGGAVVHVIAGRVRDLTHKLAGLSAGHDPEGAFPSRDFR